ncbi:MAG: hypothetical protein KC550_05635 [Nanoarchaeota archaeon]|nr:hypothetical protein [Nanoarchaeota archaeon]
MRNLDQENIYEELKRINSMDIELMEITTILNMLGSLFERGSRESDACASLSKAFCSSNVKQGFPNFKSIIKEEVNFQRGVLEKMEKTTELLSGYEKTINLKIIENQKLIVNILNRIRVFICN